jgi:hypothetical protein
MKIAFSVSVCLWSNPVHWLITVSSEHWPFWMETALWLGVDSSHLCWPAASNSHVLDTDTGQSIRQNTDTTHPTHPDSNVRASNIDIQVGTFQRQPAVRGFHRLFAGFSLWESWMLMDYFVSIQICDGNWCRLKNLKTGCDVTRYMIM